MTPIETANNAVETARRLGADEVKAYVRSGSEVELERRAGKLERVHEASTLGLSVSLLVDERFSSHSTSDLRPEAVEAFLQRAVDGTRYLEPDPDRAMAARERMGSLDVASLDAADETSFDGRDSVIRRGGIARLEEAVLAGAGDDLVSATAFLWDMRNRSDCAFSNGFEGHSERTHFGFGGMVTLKEPSGKLPEAYSFINAAHLDDLPTMSAVAEDLWTRAAAVRDTSACASTVCPMLLDARVAPRLLGALLSPLSGTSLHHGRSCMHDKLGDKLGSSAFSVLDDPTIPRGLGSKPFDGDGFVARARPIFTEGVLNTWYVGLYHSRKLGVEPTTGRAGNVVIAPGPRSWREIAASYPECIRVTSFLGGNSNPASGDFSFGIRGQLYRHGEWAQNLSEMNVTGNLIDLISRFVEPASDVWKHSSYRVPTLVFDGVQFSGT
ncbi:MAG TPA: TldD/PmbA family protein [Myxococcota bacterium]|nr:TldD/PmbA family protein [Myxococcota bacterium]